MYELVRSRSSSTSTKHNSEALTYRVYVASGVQGMNWLGTFRNMNELGRALRL